MSKFWKNSSKDVPKKSKNFNESSLLKLNCDKALKDLAWQPTLTFDETAKFTIDWYIANIGENDIKVFTEKQINVYQEKLFNRNNLLP